MKKIFIFTLLGMFAFVGFRPPEGMRKFPVANIQFEVNTPQGQANISLMSAEDVIIVTEDSAQEEEAGN